MKKKKTVVDREDKELDDKTVYLPLEEIKSIERVISHLETTRNELQKVAEEMTAVEDCLL